MKKKSGASSTVGKIQEQPKIQAIKKQSQKTKAAQTKPKVQVISKQLEKTKQQPQLKTASSSNTKKVEQIKVLKKEKVQEKPIKMTQIPSKIPSKIPSQMPKNNNLNMNIVMEKKRQIDIKLVKEVDKQKKIVAVIVSFMSGSSYDNLFTSVEQKTQEGTQVIVYSCSSRSVNQILKGFLSQSENILVKNLIENVKSVDPDCVVFNWQCCSHYSTKKFNEGPESVFQFIKLIIDRGHMAMFSDFSLKALIAQWKENIMGPNPFVAIKQHSDFFVLHFDCQKLKDCPSAQLQIVGDMATEGHCNVHALGGTIVYGINSQKADNDFYKLQVLTVATNFSNEKNYTVEINGHKGLAGHVLLTYKSGGCLLVSMGHWIELMKIDTSQKVLFEVAARQFGQQKMKSMKMEYESLNEVQKKDYIAKNSVQFVQSQAPCKNMSKKAKKNF